MKGGLNRRAGMMRPVMQTVNGMNLRAMGMVMSMVRA